MTITTSGHQANIDGLSTLIRFASILGEQYNPANELLYVIALQTLRTQADEALQAVRNCETTLAKILEERNAEFGPFDKFITALSNSFKSFGFAPLVQENLQNYVRDIRGQRVSDKMSEQELAAEKEKGNDVRQVTQHLQTMSRKMLTFEKLVEYLKHTPEYKPNEDIFKTDALVQKLATMKQLLEAVEVANLSLDYARKNRKKFFYTENTGLVAICQMAKAYIKSRFGASSDEYKQISGLKFVSIE